MMRIPLLFLVLGCETRGVSSSLAMKSDCFSATPGHEISIHAQVRDATGEGTNNVKVRWQLTPSDPLASLSTETTSSTEAEIDGLKAAGVVSATVSLDATVKTSSVYTIVVQTIDESSLSATARVEVVEDTEDGCQAQDAGVMDAIPVDGTPSDAGADAAVDAALDAPVDSTTLD